jgi:hypothetical protein
MNSFTQEGTTSPAAEYSSMSRSRRLNKLRACLK